MALHKFKFRDYQLPIVRALEEDDFKRLILLLPRRCVAKNTQITMYNGSTKLIQDIVPGDKILSFNGKNIEVDTVRNSWATGVKKAIEIISHKFPNIVTSPDHLFFSRGEWVKAKNLTDNSPIFQQNMIKTHSKDSMLLRVTKHKSQSVASCEMYDIETENNHNFFANGYLVHNSGKDMCSLQIAVRYLLRNVCTVAYVFPTFSQARKSIYEGIDISGIRILDRIPDELCKKNSSDLKVTFHNGSILQFIGSDRYDRLRGTNYEGIVYSEFAYQDPRAFSVARPILAANNGWAIFASTPCGRHNHFYDLYQQALKKPKTWFTLKLTVDDTKHISEENLEEEKEFMSPQLFRQEFYCEFTSDVEGTIYGKNLEIMEKEGRIGEVVYDPSKPVYTAWDLGVQQSSDTTAIVFFQLIGTNIHVIDCYENFRQGAAHYVSVLKSKNYIYGGHLLPHDSKVFEWGGGLTRVEQLEDLGLDVEVVTRIKRKMHGIEKVRTSFRKMYIDKTSCKDLVSALYHYHWKWDDKAGRFNDHEPFHDHSSNFCFTGEMKVKTPNGDVSIKDIKVGDEVITPLGIRKVLKTHKRLTKKLYKINDSIECTAGHSIFTQSGMVRADALVYNDILEPYSKFRSFLWKKIFGYYTGELDIKGFKKTILFLKMKSKSCLMATFIDGIRQSTTWEAREEKIVERHTRVGVATRLFKGIFGKSTMGRLQRVMSFITRISTLGTTQLKISSCLQGMNMDTCTQPGQALGVSLKNAKRYSGEIMERQRRGIVVQREKSGTKGTQSIRCQFFEELSTRRCVLFARKHTTESRHGKNIAVVNAARNKEFFLARILKRGCVLFAIKSLSAINIVLRRHAVKNVESYRVNIPKEVYDLTIEHDNCYYVNGYLVSNCDALMYACTGLSQLQDEYTAEDLDEIREKALGSNKGPKSYGRI